MENKGISKKQKIKLQKKYNRLSEVIKKLAKLKEKRKLEEKRKKFKELNEKLKKILTAMFKNINKSNKEYMTNLVLKFMQENDFVANALVDCIKDGVKVPKKILKELVNEDLQEIAGGLLNYSNLRANLIFDSEKTSGKVINIILDYIDSYWQEKNKIKNLSKDSILAYKNYLHWRARDVVTTKIEEPVM